MNFDFLLLLPCLLILLFIFFIVIFIRSKSKTLRTNQQPLKFFIGIYVTILVVAPIIYVVIPKNEMQYLTNTERERLSAENKALHKALLKSKAEGNIDQFLVDEWIQSFKGNSLHLKMENPNKSTYLRVVERKSDSINHQIIGQLYRSNFVEQNLEITNKLNVPTITWRDSKTMTVRNPKVVKLSYVLMSDNGILKSKDSIGGNSLLEWEGDRYFESPYYLLLTVPKNVKVTIDEGLRIFD